MTERNLGSAPPKTAPQDSVTLSCGLLPRSSRGTGSPFGWLPLGPSDVRVFVPPTLVDVCQDLPRSRRDSILAMFSFFACRWFKGNCGIDGFTSEHRDTLRWLFGRDYASKVRFLVAHAGLEVTKNYAVGYQTKRYRVPVGGLRPFTIRNKPLAKKFAQLDLRKTDKTIERARQMNREETVEWMIEVITRHLQVDEHGLSAELSVMDPTNEREFNQHMYRCLSATALLDKRFIFSMDPKTGRFFSNITNLPKEFRKHLRLTGVALAEVDVKTAQPYLLSTLYPERTGEWRRFTDDIINHDFYEMFAPDGIDRDTAKKQIFTYILFGRNEIAEYGALWEPFSKRYPQMAGIIKRMKGEQPNSVALRLQELESRGMIGGVAAELAKEKELFVTIHDSVMVRPLAVPKARRLITKHFGAIVGVPPVLRQER